MSISINELRKQRDTLNAQIKAERAKQSANQKYYYVINFKSTVPTVEMVNTKPADGHYAEWTGPKGSKTLQARGNFEALLQETSSVTGWQCKRIKPLLIKHGFSWNPTAKVWAQ